MTVEHRDIPAPRDALAWVWPGGREWGFWATSDDEIAQAARRGMRMLPTQADQRGRRWLRDVAEHTHLADHIGLATIVDIHRDTIERILDRLFEVERNAAKPNASGINVFDEDGEAR
jgi:hypothetical protein